MAIGAARARRCVQPLLGRPCSLTSRSIAVELPDELERRRRRACSCWPRAVRRTCAARAPCSPPRVTPSAKQGLVAAVVVAHQAALPVAKEGPGVFARAAAREVVDHRPQGLERSGGIGPEVGAMRLALARCQHRHRRLVGMQHRAAQQLRLQGVHQRLQPHAAHAHPGRQRRARDRQAGAAEDRLPAGTAASDRHAWPPAPGPAARRWGCPCRSRRPAPGPASSVRHWAQAHLPRTWLSHGEHARRVVQLLAHVLAHALQLRSRSRRSWTRARGCAPRAAGCSGSAARLGMLRSSRHLGWRQRRSSSCASSAAMSASTASSNRAFARR